jgi:hypothetical protein
VSKQYAVSRVSVAGDRFLRCDRARYEALQRAGQLTNFRVARHLAPSGKLGICKATLPECLGERGHPRAGRGRTRTPPRSEPDARAATPRSPGRRRGSQSGVLLGLAGQHRHGMRQFVQPALARRGKQTAQPRPPRSRRQFTLSDAILYCVYCVRCNPCRP